MMKFQGGCRKSIISEKSDREFADAVLEINVRANQRIVDELKGENSMCQALLEIMEPEINKIVESERKKFVLIAVKSFRDLGANDNKIIEILKRDYGLSMNEAGEYL